jgi:alpha-methylacyl-CoA racemase
MPPTVEIRTERKVPGPLSGLRVIELAGIGAGPFAGMLLADMGADVVRIDRTVPAGLGADIDPSGDVLGRGRRSIAVDLKDPRGLELALRLADTADALIEAFRPGVAERLGLGPHVLHARNPRLVYGRMTGWGQEGPWAPRAGHDIDYIALAGALHPIGPAAAPPPPPINLVGDFGGGGLLLAFGVVCALVERGSSGKGQVVDAAMIDGAAIQTAMLHGMLALGAWSTQRESNLLDGAAPFYRTYTCADGEHIAVGALEPQFYAELLERLELPPEEWPQHDLSRWPEQTAALAELFATRTRAEWAERFAGSDACVAPVLSLSEAGDHPHMAARKVIVDHHGVRQPAPAPRFDRTPAALTGPPVVPGRHTDEVLSALGLSAAERSSLRAAGVISDSEGTST